ncbi:hypothetical protein MN608_07062 [Microdochium nivale]|nr:hypothetical protein MN608_07062 [Microdochium nivale]
MPLAKGSNRWNAKRSMKLVILLLQANNPDLTIRSWKAIESTLPTAFEGKVSIGAAQQQWLKLKKTYLEDGGEALKDLLAATVPPSSGDGSGGGGEDSKVATGPEPDSDDKDEEEDEEEGEPADKRNSSGKDKHPAMKDQSGDGDASGDFKVEDKEEQARLKPKTKKRPAAQADDTTAAKKAKHIDAGDSSGGGSAAKKTPPAKQEECPKPKGDPAKSFAAFMAL